MTSGTNTRDPSKPGHDSEGGDLANQEGSLGQMELVHVVRVLQLLDAERHQQQAGQLYQDDYREYLQADGTLQLA